MGGEQHSIHFIHLIHSIHFIHCITSYILYFLHFIHFILFYTPYTLQTSLTQGKRESSAPQKGKGKVPQAKKGKGRRSATSFAIEFHQATRPRARAHERNETKRFPDWASPPTSDVINRWSIIDYSLMNQ